MAVIIPNSHVSTKQWLQGTSLEAQYLFHGLAVMGTRVQGPSARSPVLGIHRGRSAGSHSLR